MIARRVLAFPLAALLLVACAEQEPPVSPEAPDQAASNEAAGTMPATVEPELPAGSVDAPPVAARESADSPPTPDPAAAAAAWNRPADVVAADQVDAALERADAAMQDARIDQGEGSALGLYLAVLAVEPGNERAADGRDAALDALLLQGRQALDERRVDDAERSLSVLSAMRADAPDTVEFAQRVQSALATERLLSEAEVLEAAGGDAIETYQQVLQRDPDQPAATLALERITQDLLRRATRAAEAGEYADSDQLLADAARVLPGSDHVQDAGIRIVEMRQQRAAGIAAQAGAAIVNGDLEAARRLLAEMERVTVQGQGIDELRASIEHASLYGRYAPGQFFSDPINTGGDGPELVVVPVGSFEMGSPRSERNRRKHEGPRHKVTFSRGFAISRAEISVGQFGRFVQATKYVSTAQQAGRSTIYDERSGSMMERPGANWQHDHAGAKARDELPVVHVSWTDAVAYADWLSRSSAEQYRLPSEAEFEYAMRAGSSARYPWGEDGPPRLLENVTGEHDRSASKRSWNNAFAGYGDGHWGPAPVRSFEPNAFGLFDSNGNVSEWVADCWHDSYSRAPRDGSAWINRGCTQRVIRGGSWAGAPDQVRAAFRLSAPPTTTSARVGFRVVRVL